MSEISDVLTKTIEIVAAAVPELNAYSVIVPSVVMPAVMAFPPDTVRYDETMSDDATMLYVVRLYVERTQDGADQNRLNDYISRTGPKSVVAAIKANPRLGGTVDDARVVEAVNYGNWPIGARTYLGVELRIQAMLG